jgi:hypothetical protein
MAKVHYHGDTRGLTVCGRKVKSVACVVNAPDDEGDPETVCEKCHAPSRAFDKELSDMIGHGKWYFGRPYW